VKVHPDEDASGDETATKFVQMIEMIGYSI